jgi:hypothetical protein
MSEMAPAAPAGDPGTGGVLSENSPSGAALIPAQFMMRSRTGMLRASKQVRFPKGISGNPASHLQHGASRKKFRKRGPDAKTL